MKILEPEDVNIQPAGSIVTDRFDNVGKPAEIMVLKGVVPELKDARLCHGAAQAGGSSGQCCAVCQSSRRSTSLPRMSSRKRSTWARRVLFQQVQSSRAWWLRGTNTPRRQVAIFHGQAAEDPDVA